MNTSDLIRQFTTDLKPVKPQASPLRFAIGSVIYFAAIVCAELFLLPIRSDWSAKVFEMPFLLDLIFSTGLVLSSLGAIALLSSPGRGKATGWIRGILVVLICIFAFGILRTQGLGLVGFADGLDKNGFKCFLFTLCFSIIPAIAIGIATRSRASTRPKFVGIAMAFACLGAGSFAITFHCGLDNAMHIATAHFLLTFLVGGFLFGAIGKKIANW